MARRSALTFFLFLLPGLLFYSLFLFWPMIYTFYLSLFKWQGTRLVFVGFTNYIELCSDEIFIIALTHNVIWVILTLLIPVLGGLILAALLVNRRFSGTLVVLNFLPRLVPLAVSGAIWSLIYSPIGPLNEILKKIGLGAFALAWLGEPNVALYALNIAGAWTYYGFCTFLFYNAMKNLDPRLYEAARIDGATSFQQFLYITLPSLKNVLIFVIALSTILAMGFFDLIHLSTQGGPGYATEVLGIYIYRLVTKQANIEYASAVSTSLLFIVLVITVIALRYYLRE